MCGGAVCVHIHPRWSPALTKTPRNTPRLHRLQSVQTVAFLSCSALRVRGTVPQGGPDLRAETLRWHWKRCYPFIVSTLPPLPGPGIHFVFIVSLISLVFSALHREASFALAPALVFIALGEVFSRSGSQAHPRLTPGSGREAGEAPPLAPASHTQLGLPHPT